MQHTPIINSYRRASGAYRNAANEIVSRVRGLGEPGPAAPLLALLAA
jgi:hypothetical protein